jgi:predicted DNA-binding transcriptional regulator AlpA
MNTVVQQRQQRQSQKRQAPDATIGDDSLTLIGVHDLARMLGFTVQTAQRMARDGRLPRPLRLTHRYQWPLSEVRKFIADQYAAAQRGGEGDSR